MADTAARTTASAARRPGSRVGWVDSAKGLCIFLVVLGHAITELANHGYSTGIWAEVNFVLGPIRMPLFFLLSGLFAAKALSESWDRLANRRIWVMVWLYVVWVPVREIVLALLPYSHVTADGLTRPPRIMNTDDWPSMLYNSLHALVEPTSYLWFLWALALFAILSKLLRGISPLIQIAVAAVIYVTAPFAGVSWSWDFVSKMLVFYLLGLHGAPLIFRMVARRPIWFLIASAGAYVVVAVWILRTFPSFNAGNRGVVGLFLSTAGLFAIINVMAMLQNSPVVRPFEKIGHRTLPVFLMHIPMLGIIAIVADQFFDGDPGLPLQPVVAAAVAAALCLSLHRLLLRVGAEWLFKRPDWFIRLTTPHAAATSVTPAGRAGEKAAGSAGSTESTGPTGGTGRDGGAEGTGDSENTGHTENTGIGPTETNEVEHGATREAGNRR
ncbi:acyltransferase family protein [uncultured Corynebacterium sp.]|uniref:acyltransferase family protein n=1 Tax=uncultured Corynebacterium sp. TaxID=159447 RepID=UPI0025D4A1AA|nr:acyltransferase family protein [uncultured Corynebacterium sp.]